MSDDTNTSTKSTVEQGLDSETLAVTDTYKILGELSAGDGVGVLGQNNASGGIPIGVEGAVPNNSDGYGLATPNSARVGETIESPGGHTLTVDGTPTCTLGVTGSDNEGETAGGNVIAGYAGNGVQNSAVGAVVAGGGSSGSDTSRNKTNEVTDNYGAIGGGQNNRASRYGTVSGGSGNTASGSAATIAGGSNNVADGNFSFAAGRRAETDGNDGAFVWGDSSNSTVQAGQPDEVRFQAGGGFVIAGTNSVTISDGIPDLTGAGVAINSSGTLVKDSSSARYKTNIRPLEADTGRVLDLEPRRFEYEESGAEGTGLIAEEVEAEVPELVVYDEEGRPDAVQYDRIGVYLVPEVDENRDRIDELEAENEDLREENEDVRQALTEKEERLADLEERLAALETQVSTTVQPADD